MAKKFDAQQREAIDALGTNVLVSASAGAGKTGVLVERLTKRTVIDHVSISRIAAMTFTQAAAEEMKKRLGDDTLVQSFLSQGPVVEVTCSLAEDSDTVSGYAWSSKKGKDVYLADGTMLEASIITERKAPITMVIPLLKELFTESVSSRAEEAQ